MDGDSVMFFLYGVLLLVFGVGLRFVALGPASYRRDDERYGPLSKLGMGMMYAVIKTDRTRKWISVVAIVSGIATIVYASVHP